MQNKLMLQALETGLIGDQPMAYIRALYHARVRQGKAEGHIYDAIKDMFRSIQGIYQAFDRGKNPKPFSALESDDSGLAKERLGEGLSDFDIRHEAAAMSVPASIVSYLEGQRIVLIPLQIGSSSIAEVGKTNSFDYRLCQQLRSRQMYDLREYWIGLYFDTEQKRSENPGKAAQNLPYFHPDAITVAENTVLNFVDANLRGATIDLFYRGMMRKLFRRSSKDKIFHLNLTFKNCWVKGMNLAFWHSVAEFPGSITFLFEDCKDFDAAYFPYLRREIAGNHYYLDLEKFADEVSEMANPKFLQHIEDILCASASYQYEHLR